jgi:hypothetical protein
LIAIDKKEIKQKMTDATGKRKQKLRYNRQKSAAKKQRDYLISRVRRLNEQDWSQDVGNPNEKHFGTPSKLTSPNIYLTTPTPEREGERERAAARSTSNLTHGFTTMFMPGFAYASEPSKEDLAHFAMNKLKKDGLAHATPRNTRPRRHLIRYQKEENNRKLNQQTQEASRLKANAFDRNEELDKINAKLIKNLRNRKREHRRLNKKITLGGNKRSVRRKSRSPRRKSRSPRRKSRSPRRKSRSPRRKSRGGKRPVRSPRRTGAGVGKEFGSIRKYLENMPAPMKVAFPGYIMYHIVTDKEAFF